MDDAVKIFNLNPVLHQRTRMAIMSLLCTAAEPLEFTRLLKRLQLTKGNLALHLRKLEEAGYLKVHKEFVERIPRTTYIPTTTGRRDFTAYLGLLEEIIAGAREDEEEEK
ncbi:MAG: helix-turn-helix domain-containing protein [Candidatus Coatesbacteria bacterium]|nr:helix-turn-helix domain-containing protein [Candidatus Coatesbacteria bacterium]